MYTTVATYYSFYMTVCCPLDKRQLFFLHDYIEMHGQQNIKKNCPDRFRKLKSFFCHLVLMLPLCDRCFWNSADWTS
jgi:hypothetical protein